MRFGVRTCGRAQGFVVPDEAPIEYQGAGAGPGTVSSDEVCSLAYAQVARSSPMRAACVLHRLDRCCFRSSSPARSFNTEPHKARAQLVHSEE